MTLEALLDTYYEGLAKRTGWEQTMADDFDFTGGSPNSGSRGKAAYREVIRRFSRAFETVSVKDKVVHGDRACVIASYGIVSPTGQRTVIDVAEVWTAGNGQLTSLAIYFDTASWKAFMAA
jgi:ketosteroid isomerase-like protein